MRTHRGRALLGAALLVATGCGEDRGRASRYRAEAMLHQARRQEAELRVTGAQPDSTSLIRMRQSYGALRKKFPPPFVPGGDPEARRLAREVARQVGQAELEAARLAMEARSPALALESAQWVASIADADTGLHREADLSAVRALRTLRRFDDAVDVMRSMLERYPPAAPPDPSREDAVLKLPDVIIALRRDLGDTAAVRAELGAALGYYRRVLGRGPSPLLEQQVRVRIARTHLELHDAHGALAELKELERLSLATPILSALTPEVIHTRARVEEGLGDAKRALASYDRVVAAYPESPFAPLSLVDAGVLEERRGNLQEAIRRYRQVLAAYPKDDASAPIALFRMAMVQDASGDWATAKQSLESLPLRFPRSRAAAEAPLAVVSHYQRVRDKDAQQSALVRAVQTYRQLVASDTTSAVAILFRWNILRAQVAGENWAGALAAVDDLAAKDRGTALAAQALFEGARVARQMGDQEREGEYLGRLRREYPGVRVKVR